MDEKEAVKRTRNSFRAGKSRAEVMRRFQKKGYTLEYADKIISKSMLPKKLLITFLLSGMMIIILAVVGYSLISSSDFSFPGLSSITGNAVSDIEKITEISEKEYALESESISEILRQVGAEELHYGILYGNPIINFEIEGQRFYSTVDEGIRTERGLSEDADLQLEISLGNFYLLLNSEDYFSDFKKMISSGEISVTVLSSKPELFSKGYLGFYERLNT